MDNDVVALQIINAKTKNIHTSFLHILLSSHKFKKSQTATTKQYTATTTTTAMKLTSSIALIIFLYNSGLNAQVST